MFVVALQRYKRLPSYQGGCKWFRYRWGGRVQVVPLLVGRAGASCSFSGD
ncbi:MAG: hypothetical protein RIE73_27275 [Coleofasciculus sp. C1-SOL-03]